MHGGDQFHTRTIRSGSGSMVSTGRVVVRVGIGVVIVLLVVVFVIVIAVLSVVMVGVFSHVVIFFVVVKRTSEKTEENMRKR